MKISIDADEKRTKWLSFKEVVILITCNIKDDGKYYLQLLLKEALNDEKTENCYSLAFEFKEIVLHFLSDSNIKIKNYNNEKKKKKRLETKRNKYIFFNGKAKVIEYND